MDLRWLPQNGHHAQKIGERALKKLLGMVAVLMLLGTAAQAAPEKIIIDTDIGDDIDDAFAMALALKSPELQVLGMISDFGDTPMRSRMLDRLLADTGHKDIPVATGIASSANLAGFSQRRYAEGAPAKTHPAGVDFLLEQIRRHPGEITLVAIGPSPNLGAAIDKDPATFRKLKRIVMMGGSINPVSDGFGDATPPHPEWNIKNDIGAAQKIFTSGVPLFVMPLDSTIGLKLDEIRRNILFSRGTAMTDMLAVTYHQWVYGTHGQVTPTLFDPMTLAYLVKPSLCPVTPLRVRVDDVGATLVEPGAPNAQVCLKSDPAAFLDFYLERVAK